METFWQFKFLKKTQLNTIDVAFWRTISLQRRKTTGQPTQEQIQNNVSLWVYKFDVCFHAIVVLIFVASDIFHLRKISIFRILFLCKKKIYIKNIKKTSYNETTDISLRLSPEMHITCFNIYMFYCASWVGKSWYIYVRRCRTLWFFALRIEFSLPLNVNQKVSNHLGLIGSFLCLWKMLTRFFKKVYQITWELLQL